LFLDILRVLPVTAVGFRLSTALKIAGSVLGFLGARWSNLPIASIVGEVELEGRTDKEA